MKFTDGYWQLRPGVTPYYAAQVHEVEIVSDAMMIHAPTKKSASRGDTLNLPMLSMRFSSPMENVIRVEIPDLNGRVETVCDVGREQDVIRIERTGPSRMWKVSLVNIHSIESGAAARQTPQGMLITAEASTNAVEIKVPAA